MSQQATAFTTTVGRLVAGSIYEARKKTDTKGQPVIDKTTGQQLELYDFAVAFQKTPGQHWASSLPFGAVIWAAGHAAFPGGQAQRPDFAWKVTDGDSAIPNKKGKKPCDNEGYPGHWVFWFSSQFAPKIFNADGSAPIHEVGAVKRGYYVQVCGTVKGNTGDSPGVYLNHNMLALAGFGPEIVSGPDVASAGFGQGVTLPPGASALPVGGFAPPAVVGVAVPPVAAPTVPYTAPAPVYAAPVPAVQVQPNPGFLSPPTVGAAPPPVGAAPAPVAAPPAGPQMTAAALATYAEYIKAGWTDVLLRQNGLMV